MMRWRRVDWRENARRWRWRFALVPIQIRDRWIWFEWYRFKGNGIVWSREFAENAGQEKDDCSFVSY